MAVSINEVDGPEGHIAELSVTDEGPGIAQAERDRIFYKGWHAVGHVNELKATKDLLEAEAKS